MILNAAISINILLNIFQLSVVVVNTFLEGTVSQISFPGPKSNFMQLENQIVNNFTMFPAFGHKIKTKP